ncbi:hypothetical protein NE237_025064 [Protea cynaroides]|uniref:Uncharacterized protein n=1 Tax=Protea cynaroides TaxID=273540 RepID=A0A9Q0H470_9MAGN|nr:hypothetical protein NE237_025064 [Protea cynaroides]
MHHCFALKSTAGMETLNSPSSPPSLQEIYAEETPGSWSWTCTQFSPTFNHIRDCTFAVKSQDQFFQRDCDSRFTKSTAMAKTLVLIITANCRSSTNPTEPSLLATTWTTANTPPISTSLRPNSRPS